MTLTKNSLRVIQRAGTEVHKAEQYFKDLVKQLSKELGSQLDAGGKVSAAEELWDELKVVENIAIELSSIESRLQISYRVVSEAGGHKRGRKLEATKATGAKATRKGPRGPRKGTESNPDRLVRYLQSVLVSDGFKRISQSEAARTVGIPVGSVTAALKRLMDQGRIVPGAERGTLKLPD